jgi:hypothetical protein
VSDDVVVLVFVFSVDVKLEEFLVELEFFAEVDDSRVEMMHFE